MMKKLPTDRKILKKIYSLYYDVFRDYQEESKTRSSKVYVPIDIEKLAMKLSVDSHLIFGRLYYHMDKKYGYTQSDDSKVHLFTPIAGNDKNAVNFPLLGAIVAEMEDAHRKNILSIIISLAALAISLVSIGVTIF
jgi:hypothetical protein